MAKDFHALIRLYQYRVDEKRRALGVLLGNVARLENERDRLVLETQAFENYLAAMSQEPWDNLEHAAVTLLDDIHDQLIARWIQLSVTGGQGHSILLEDRQPKWENPQLLQRLRRL